MLSTLRDAWRIPDLRKKIIFTLLMLFIYRLGSFISVPYIDTAILAQYIQDGGMLGFYDIFAGGNFSNFTIFAMSITPYINASIIMNLLTFAIPALERLSKEGEDGRKKLAQYTRYLTVVLALVQALGMTLTFQQIMTERTWFTITLAILTVTAGTAFLMWLGEQITENGIGNGISLIIFVSIISRLPFALKGLWEYVQVGTLNIFSLVLFFLFALLVIVFVIAVQEGQRRIPVQYSKRVVGRKMYGGQSTHIPLKVNMSGVIPVIFASSITMFPATLANFFPNSGVANWIVRYFGWGTTVTTILYISLIIAFTFFYTAITFNPIDIANNLKKNGGFIPGIRPGRPTTDYINKSVTKLTLFGGIFLAAVATVPIILGNVMNVNLQFGGTSLLIVVGVAIESIKQLESQMMMRHYNGFLK
ncbi:preprotein translocase subunit SecY [Alkalibacter saccharofermentans]|uniref:Protein translocase subunit SecY n=1 Tax=Alkalibacter saccharofermentans DSM 14828 TaxID=1120975 RepID=A0A1M4Y8Q8_9FIRM|nr:preprotein translocase subunit SecY [Alkalibacter saccharofermentans]SHF02184.1 protein translocase subunit secY/sec61 alpha [Alkalibacter saccharofermentans DSM 14828]